MTKLQLLVGLAILFSPVLGYAASWQDTVTERAAAIESKVVAIRHDLHAHPELGNREFKTAAKIAEHLRALNFDEVQTGVAHTGVVGILKGRSDFPVVALRADMDGLP
ncbi:MAG: amidohydrolase, partial [Pseudomonadales bacterium]|nr:amidohydrolase [Pseudomonadales bacterium]